MKKSVAFRTEVRAADGSFTHHETHDKFETAVDHVVILGNNIPPGKRPWQQPETMVYELFSDGSTDLVYHEFFLNDARR